MKPTRCPAGGGRRHQWARFTRADVRDDRESIVVEMFRQVDLIVWCRRCGQGFRAQAEGVVGKMFVDDSTPVQRARRRNSGRAGQGR